VALDIGNIIQKAEPTPPREIQRRIAEQADQYAQRLGLPDEDRDTIIRALLQEPRPVATKYRSSLEHRKARFAAQDAADAAQINHTY
jgi:hypothetical protein